MSEFTQHSVVATPALTRRQFLGTTGATGLLAMLALPQAPVFAQRREVSMITWNHFVPASDERLKEIAADFGKRNNVNLQIDTIAHLQVPQKLAAEVQTRTGHDLVWMYNELPYLYEQQLVPMDDLVSAVEKQYGGLYPFAKESAFVNGTWRALPWMWISFPGTYNQLLFAKYGQQVPDTWDDLLKAGWALKKAGHPVGIAISHCTDANTTFWSILWCYGGKVLDADGKTVALNSPQTQQVLEYYRALYHDAMDAEVLSWDDASNNRCVLAGKCAWIHNPV
ncbi:MAG TPA: extracellular solute-binding protein, partial [Gammaproteobacteria bacterium]|nr:extracellular solute-binding protein [Gammaproteobacteria bacterium]